MGKTGKQLETLWAKAVPFVSIAEHMTAAGGFARALLSGMARPLLIQCSKVLGMSLEDTLNFFCWLIYLHDVGKIHPAFQGKADDPELIRRLREAGFPVMGMTGFRHEIYSAMVLARILKEKYGMSFRAPAARIAETVRLHHPGKSGTAPEMPEGCERYTEAQNLAEDYAHSMFPFEKFPESCSDYSLVCSVLQDVMILSDHYASRFGVCDYARVLKTSGIGMTPVAAQKIYDLFPFLRNSLRPLQKAAEQIGGGFRLVLLEDIPGGGKTEAAVALALRAAACAEKTGVYFAFPTGATASQGYERIREALRNAGLADPKLARGMPWHGMDGLGAEAENDALGTGFLEIPQRKLLAPYCAGTVDQLMLGFVRSKQASARRLGIACKAVVIDEVHAYDTYMQAILFRAIKWCMTYGCPVILLSATLTEDKKKELLKSAGAEIPEGRLSGAYPLITVVDSGGKVKEIHAAAYRSAAYRVETKPMLNDIPSMAGLAKSCYDKGGCIAVMCNTVADAVKTYKELKEAGAECMLFHSRYTGEDREKLESEAVRIFGKNGSRPERIILVCTQVAEQSLDLDFDVLITQTCPGDLLIQRLGRLWRHERTRPQWLDGPLAYVCTGDIRKSGTGRVYPLPVLKASEKALTDRMDNGAAVLRIPEDVRDFVEESYRGFDPASQDTADMLFRQQVAGAAAAMAAIPSPSPKRYYKLAVSSSASSVPDETNPATRDGESSERLILAMKGDREAYEAAMSAQRTPENRKALSSMADRLLPRMVQVPGYMLPEGTARVVHGPLKGCVIAESEGGSAYSAGGKLFTYGPEGLMAGPDQP